MADIETLATPAAWWKELSDRYTSGTSHAFVLTGAINDYVSYGFNSELRSTLALTLSGRNDIVVIYDVAKGVRFADEMVKLNRPDGAKTMRQLFGIATGLSNPPAGPAGANPAMLAALKQAQGGATGKLDDLGSAPGEILPLLDRLMRTTRRVCVVIDYADLLCPAGDKSTRPMPERVTLATLEGWGHDPKLIENANMLLLIAASAADVHSDIRAASARYHWIEIPLPGEDDRREYIEYILAKRAPRGLKLEDGFSVRNFAAATSGLMKSAIEDIVLLAMSQPDKTITRVMVRDRKTEIIKSEYGDVVAFLEPSGGLDTLGGLDNVKAYLRDRVVKPIVAGNAKRAPVGIVFLGPPGTGKTAMATALAFESGINCLQFRPDRILNSLLGQSERNLEKLLVCIKSLSPCFLFLDELDQKVKRGGNSDSSSTMNNIFGRLLEFISQPSNKGRIVFIAASNQPDLIDPALIRAGRIEIKIPFLPPNSNDRMSIFRAILVQQDAGAIVADPAWIASTDGWTGAEIAKAINKASVDAELSERLMTADDISRAIRQTRRRAQDYQSYIDAAIAATDDIDLLPIEYQEALVAQTALQAPAPIDETEDNWRVQRRL
jgi:SpoVK/Ycf46/Vps4 family AAA+-type ATPase